MNIITVIRLTASKRPFQITFRACPLICLSTASSSIFSFWSVMWRKLRWASATQVLSRHWKKLEADATNGKNNIKRQAGLTSKTSKMIRSALVKRKKRIAKFNRFFLSFGLTFAIQTSLTPSSPNRFNRFVLENFGYIICRLYLLPLIPRQK